MLLLFCSDNYNILLLSDKQSSYLPLKEMFQNELKILKNYFKKNLIKRFIHFNNSSTAVLILFIKKSLNNLYLCINYQKLNDITVKNCYLLSLIKKTLKCLS